MSADIKPIGGKHRSAKSLLAEIMNDTQVAKLVILTIDKDGNTGFAQYEMTRAEMCYASIIIQQEAFS